MSVSHSQADSVDRSPPRDGSRETAGAAWENPRTIGSYDILHELGCGGQAVVYKACHRRTGAVVALKVLSVGPVCSEKARCQFDREIDLVAHLDHPSIVKVHDKGVCEHGYYFAMDYVQGQPLEECLGAKNLSFRAKMRLLREICDGVAHAHQRGVIHRDLKPSNILVDERGSPHILDFGYAKAAGTLGPGASVISVSLEIKGTPAYLSPEQAEGRPGRVDIRTDVYTLGVLCYRVLTGQFPYNVSGGLTATLVNVRSTEPTRPRALCPRFDSDVEAILLKCLEKDPDRRYHSAAELRDEIERWLAGLEIHARSGLFYVLRKRAARHWYTTSVVGLLAVIVAGFATTSLVRDRHLKEENSRLQKQLDAHQKNAVFVYGLESYVLASMLLSGAEQDRGKLKGRARLATEFLSDSNSVQAKSVKYRSQFDNSGYPFLFKVLVAECQLREKHWPEALRSYEEATQEESDPYKDMGLRWLVDYRLKQLRERDGLTEFSP